MAPLAGRREFFRSWEMEPPLYPTGSLKKLPLAEDPAETVARLSFLSASATLLSMAPSAASPEKMSSTHASAVVFDFSVESRFGSTLNLPQVPDEKAGEGRRSGATLSPVCAHFITVL